MQKNSRFAIAIHVCLYLQFKGEQLVSSQQIAASVGTNPVVIRRLIGKLKAQGIVGSVAGARGGFFLQKPSSEITLWSIYLSVKEQDLFHKPSSNQDCPVGSNLSVLVDDAFSKAELCMESFLATISINDLNARLSSILELEEDRFC